MVAGTEEGESVREGVEGQGGDAEGGLGGDLSRVLPRHARVKSSMSSMGGEPEEEADEEIQ